MSKVNWHKSAVRDVRPFFGVATLEESLQGAEIKIFDDAQFSSEVAFIVEPQHTEKLRLTIRPNFKPILTGNSELKKADLVLALTVVQPFLKKTCVVAQLPLTESVTDEIVVGDEILAQLGGGSNINVEVALCLATRLKKKPGSPFLLGHWLSKKRFSLRQPKLAEEFDVQPMDDQGWEKMGLPAKTLYYVEYFGGMNEPAAKDKQIAKVRVHVDMHNKLTLETNQRLAKPMMATLAAEIACQMLTASFSDWQGADEVTPQSPLAAFLKRLDRVQHCDLARLKNLVKAPGMPILKAMLHADQQTVRSITEG